jgi:hypothetical protein
VATNNPNGITAFANPSAVAAEFGPCVLGIYTNCGGYANLWGLPTWNLDASIIKDIGVRRERTGATLFFQFTNILNHMQPGNPSLNLSNLATFGTITSQANTPRNIEFGLRIHF